MPRQVSRGGAFTYSNVITLTARGTTSEFVVNLYPTIATGGQVYIQVGNMSLTTMSFVVVDSRGAIVMAGNVGYQSQWLTVALLPHGAYQLVLRSGSQHWHSTFIR